MVYARTGLLCLVRSTAVLSGTFRREVNLLLRQYRQSKQQDRQALNANKTEL